MVVIIHYFKGMSHFILYYLNTSTNINEKMGVVEIEALDLLVRSGNWLHRAGFQTIGQLVEAISGPEDSRKIRNCGTKSVDEIVEQYLRIYGGG